MGYVMRPSKLLKPIRWRRFALLAISFVLGLGIGAVQAAGVVGTGTPESCTEAALDAALAGGGSLTFNCGTAPHTIILTSTKTIAADTTVDGGHLVTLSGGDTHQILRVNSGVNVTLRNLTLAEGYGDFGGGVYNDHGSVTVINSAFLGNTAFSEGGAIWGYGNFVISNTAFVGNSTVARPPLPGEGSELGGAVIGTSGSLSVVGCTFSNNVGGLVPETIYHKGGALNITDSAFTANQPSVTILAGNGTIGAITNSTVSGNTAGILVDDHSGAVSLILRNTIIANNSTNCSGPIIDGGNNLQFPGTSCGATIPVADPKLGPLAANGGVTQTMALLPGSPAIDAGNNSTCPATDQRGVPRVDGDNNGSAVCDIGAYEFAPAALPSDDYADLWWNPDTAGLVLNIHQNSAGIAFAVWYTYDIDHKDMWLTLQGDWVAPDTFAGTLYRTTGPAIGGPSDPALVTLFPAGSGILSFTDADNGTFSYSVSGVADSKPITRFEF
jgi:hypothetical protein